MGLVGFVTLAESPRIYADHKVGRHMIIVSWHDYTASFTTKVVFHFQIFRDSHHSGNSKRLTISQTDWNTTGLQRCNVVLITETWSVTFCFEIGLCCFISQSHLKLKLKQVDIFLFQKRSKFLQCSLTRHSRGQSYFQHSSLLI